MRHHRLLVSLGLLLAFAPSASAHFFNTFQLNGANRRMAGKVLEFTSNHGRDNRVWSNSLQQCRDIYVYTPPCYNPGKQYPVVFYLHGFLQDERSFFTWIEKLDRAIRDGWFPPTIVVAPDGSINGKPSNTAPVSFYINSKAGKFEDYLMIDIWEWAHRNFSIRPEREAHAFVGVSMGGGAAYDVGIRHRDKVGVLVGMFPALNLRWVDCHGQYFGNFDPNCWGWREDVRRKREPIGKYFAGAVRITIGRFVEPLFGFGQDAVSGMSEHNPIEHLTRENIQNGEQALFVGYAGRDEFNLDAQAESFLYVARQRGIKVTTAYAPWGHHNTPTALRLLPETLCWLAGEFRKLP